MLLVYPGIYYSWTVKGYYNSSKKCIFINIGDQCKEKMLAKRLKQLLSSKCPVSSFLQCGAVPCHIRNYYGDSEAVDSLAAQLTERRFLMKKRALTTSESFLAMHGQEKRKRKAWLSTEAPDRYAFNWTNFAEWKAMREKDRRIKKQTYYEDRHEKFGKNVAAAVFVFQNKGKVRFKDDANWLKGNTVNLLWAESRKHNPKYVIEALDLSNTLIEYEGLLNICDLPHLKWLSFKGCPTIDEWGIDRLSAEYPNLEYLDLSECPKITERALECLYRMPSLKTLIVTNRYNSPAFELSCYMLEDVNPNLKCEIKDLKIDPESTETIA